MGVLWRIEMLGWLRATGTLWVGDRVVARFRTRQAGALLAYLAYFNQRSHPRVELIELLWPECAAAVGRSRLSVVLSSLRRQLEPPGIPPGTVLTADRDSVRLNPAALCTDVAQFEAACRDGLRTGLPPGRRAEQLLHATSLYRGSLLPGYFDEWISPERQRLADAYQEILCQLAGLHEAAGDHAGALQWARQAVAADPLCEEAQSELSRLLAVRLPPAGHGPFGGPDPLLEGPLRSTLSRPGTRSEAAPSASSPGATGSLPLPMTRFFGREAEITHLGELLMRRSGDVVSSAAEEGIARLAPPLARLTTLTGPAGSGKTRLAIEAVRRLCEGAPGSPRGNAVWFVPLADLTDPGLILEKLREALALPPTPSIEPLEHVVAFLARQPALLLLDNFEHLLATSAGLCPGASLVRTLIERVGSLTVLVTSRRVLNLPGEREFPVLPLPVPVHSPLSTLAACPSVALFVDRAQAVRPDFQLTPANADAVTRLCARLEGLPLAIELAAARAGVLTAAQMLDWLERRFELLVSRTRGVEPRHRSLRAALEWSYQLLPAELQRFFARLAVFRGGWTLVAAESVCAVSSDQALEYVTRLRECSLVQADESGSEMRFRLLETVQEYAAQQLGPDEQDALARRHAQYHLGLAEQAEAALRGPAQREWLLRLDQEHANLRAALDWTVASWDGPTALRLVAALAPFWYVRGYWAEWQVRSDAVRALPEALQRTAMRARALCRAGLLARLRGNLPEARAYAAEALAISQELGDPYGVALALQEQAPAAPALAQSRSLLESSLAIFRRLGHRWETANVLFDLSWACSHQGDSDTARALLTEGLAIFRELGDTRSIAWSLYGLGLVADNSKEWEAARSCFAESLALFRELGNPHGAGNALMLLGRTARAQGEWAAAESHLEESRQIFSELGETAAIAWTLLHRGDVRADEGVLAAAQADFRTALGLFRQQSLRVAIGTCVQRLAGVAARSRQPARAVRLLGAAEALRRTQGVDLEPCERPRQQQQLDELRARLGEAAFTAAWQSGQALSWEQAAAEALGEPLPATSPPPASSSAAATRRLPAADLTADEWSRIAPLLPYSAGRRGRPFRDHRQVINGILWVLRADARWRDLPAHYGCWRTCHDRYTRWRRQGLWDRILRALEDNGPA